MGVDVDPRLRDVMPLDTIDIPAGVQALADTLSSFVPCYDGEDERDAEWDGADIGDGGVCILRSDPAALYVLNPDSGVWARFAPEGLRETGAVGLVFAAGATESAVATVTFAQAFETPPIVNSIMNAIANSMGVSKVIEPLNIVVIQLNTFTPVGTAISIVAYMKNSSPAIGMPTVYMWCAHTMKLRKAIEAVAYTIEL